MHQFLDDSVYVVRKSCVSALGRIKSERSLPVLSESLADDHFAVRLTAWHAILNFEKAAKNTVVGLLNSTTPPRTLALAARLVGELELTDALPRLEKLTQHQDPAVRGWVLWSWGRLRGPNIRERLRSLLVNEEDLFVQSQLVNTIEYLQNQPADDE
jgi:HEAT repeat protein